MITSYYSNKLNAIKENNSNDNKSLSQQQLSTESDAQDDRYQSENISRNLHISTSISETKIDEVRQVNNQQTFDEQIQIQ